MDSVLRTSAIDTASLGASTGAGGDLVLPV